MSSLKYGFVYWSDARTVANFAHEAELAGWDGFFVGEALWHVDAWVSLAAAAMLTNSIRLGTMLTPLPSMKPRKLASQAATLDNLSGGRVILTVGMGATWMGYQGFPDEVTDLKTRAELLDEGIDILTLLFQGKQFDYAGKYHHVTLTAVDEMHYPPRPVQQPRIPIWVVGVWPRMKSMRRVLKCDGLIPAKMNPDGKFVDLQPDDLRQMKAYIEANRTLKAPFDIVVEGNTFGLDGAQVKDKLGPWVEAGATWWMETLGSTPQDELLAHIRKGPLRVE
jgi:hypothetical protein